MENACKYAPEGSEITIRSFQENGKKIIQFIDQGEGIDTKAKEKVFDKLYREENESTRKSKGTGLGLYITQFLIEKQKGKIVLRDNKPQGLIVEIQF
jgi:K+-sensing histidine kinase KdpD